MPSIDPAQVSATSETLVSQVSATSETLVQNCYKGVVCPGHLRSVAMPSKRDVGDSHGREAGAGNAALHGNGCRTKARGGPPLLRSRNSLHAHWTQASFSRVVSSLAGEVFPTCAEFRHAGQGGLLTALRRQGGLELWAARLGLPRRERYSGRVALPM
jgi:hypothetical protein